MRRSALQFALLAVMISAVRAETIERVVAIVNGQTILLSEWDTAARVEALLDHRSLETIVDTTRRATFDRMIDQALLRSEMENSSVNRSLPEAVTAKLHEVRQQYPEGGTDAGWNGILAHYGVTEQELEAVVAAELDGLRLVDFRLRSSAQPDASQIAHYYSNEYEPAMFAKHARPAPLADVTPQIREILVQRKLTELTATWLQTLRAQANIQINITLPEAASKP